MLKTGARALVNIQELTEAVTYYPSGDLTNGKSIRVIVQRMEEDLVDYQFGEGSLLMSAELWIATTVPSGVATINAGLDLADVVLVDGQSAERVRIVEVLDEDPGMSHVLAVR